MVARGLAAAAIVTPWLLWVCWRVYRCERRRQLTYPLLLWVVALGSFVPGIANDYSLVFLPLAIVAARGATFCRVVVEVDGERFTGVAETGPELDRDQGLIDTGLKLRTMRLPDVFQDQDKPDLQYAEAGLNADNIVDTVLKALRYNEAVVTDGARA